MAGKGRPPLSKTEACKIVTLSMPISHDKALEDLALMARISKAELIRECIVHRYGIILNGTDQSLAGQLLNE